MLQHTFLHIQGIGAKTEKRLWDANICTWEDFTLPGLAEFPLMSATNVEFIREHLGQSQRHLENDPKYFSKRLPSNQHWRLFPHYRRSVAYLDIETTGLRWQDDHITTIALYDGAKIAYYVFGENLDDFVEDISKYDLLVTYNGKSFDIPFIEKYFGITLNKAQIDLRYILNSLGYKGGLKGCEKQFGMSRGELDGVDGYFAVLLWQEYQRTGNQTALETLLAYNIKDVVNLEPLMFHAYNLNVQKTPFFDDLQLPLPNSPSNPFTVNNSLIEAMKRKYQLQTNY